MILNHQEILHKIRRMAYQIYEANVDETQIVIAGIADNGYHLAELLKKEVEKITPLSVALCRVKMNKKSPIGQVTCDCSLDAIENKSLVLVDDVLHSGTALVYGVAFFLQVHLKQFKTAVLVDRCRPQTHTCRGELRKRGQAAAQGLAPQRSFRQ